MKTFENGNLLIEVETYSRFENIVRGYKTNASGEAVAFLGKYIVTTNYTVDELINLYKGV